MRIRYECKLIVALLCATENGIISTKERQTERGFYKGCTKKPDLYSIREITLEQTGQNAVLPSLKSFQRAAVPNCAYLSNII